MKRNTRNILIAVLIFVLFIAEWFSWPILLTILQPSTQLDDVMRSIIFFVPPFLLGLVTGQWRYIIVMPLAMFVILPFMPSDMPFWGTLLITMPILWVTFAISYALGLGLRWMIVQSKYKNQQP